MRSSNQMNGQENTRIDQRNELESGRKHRSRRWIGIVIGIVIFFAVLWLLDTALYPCTYLRNDIHKIATEPADILVLGTSNGKMGIDPAILLEGSGMSGHNLAAGSEYPVDSYYITKLALEKQAPKMIIYDLDPGYFVSEKEKGNNYVLFWHEFPLSKTKVEFSAAILDDSDIRALLFPFYEYPLKTTVPRIGTTFTRKIQGDYSIDSLKNKIQMYHENGFIEKFPVKEENFPAYKPEEFRKEALLEENVSYLQKLIDLCRENDITFVAVSMPLPDKTIEQNRSNFDPAWDYFSEFFAENKVTFYNFNREYYNAYSHLTSHFVDYDGHLNGSGARAFSAVFGNMLGFRQ